MDSVTDPPCGGGCPIRRSSDQSLLAAPQGLSQRATSFIASRRQGIHQMPFSHSPRPSGKNRRPEDRGQGTDVRRDTWPVAAVIDRCTTNRGKTSIPMPGAACPPPGKRGEGRRHPCQSAGLGDKPKAGCTSPPYDVTCKRKVAANAATDGLTCRSRCPKLHPSPHPGSCLPRREEASTGLGGPGPT